MNYIAMQNEPVGEQYDETLGKLIDYGSLASVLIERFNSFKEFDCFLDLACGTGRLIQELSERGVEIPLVGVDINREQLNVAQKKTPDAQFKKGNIFELSQMQFGFSDIHAHLGFNFLNEISEPDRMMLLQEVYQSSEISEFTVEIWNLEHQIKSFEEGVVYTSSINGLEVESSWKSLNDDSDKFNLSMKIRSRDKLIELSKDMYRFSLENLRDIVKDAGWSRIESEPALYRGGNEESHFLVHIRR